MRKFLLLAFALTLGACVHTTQQQIDQADTSQRMSLGLNEGVVVIGVSVLHPRTNQLGVDQPLFAGWVEIDPNSGNRSGRNVVLMREICGPFGQTHACGGTQYRVYRVPAGTYALGWVSHDRRTFSPVTFSKGTITTNAIGNELRGYELSDEGRARPEAPVFTVAANEVVYAGNLVLDFTPLANGALNMRMTQGENTTEAKKALANSGLADRLTTRSWRRADALIASLPKPATTTAVVRPPVAENGLFQCFSPTLDIVYYASPCGAGSRGVDDATARQVEERHAAQRGAANDVIGDTNAIPYAPAPSGTRVYKSTGSNDYEEIVAYEDMVLTVKDQSNHYAPDIAGLFAPTLGSNIDRQALEGIWPASIGKAATVRQWDTLFEIEQNFKVLRQEKITVPAGTFDTVVIERRALGKRNSNVDVTLTYWYAPNPGVLVKVDVQTIKGTTVTKPWEATKIEIPLLTQ